MISNLKQKLKAMSTVCPLPENLEMPQASGMERGDLGGRVTVDAHGCHVVKRFIYPWESSYGEIQYAALRELKGQEAGVWTRVTSEFTMSDLIFLDTETTGLAGGTGTTAFLIGLGYGTPEGFVVEQHVMRDFDEEASMLHQVMAVLSRYRILVTFNGKSFDWPLLENRLVFNRIRTRDWEGAHIDLLHIARRLWKRKLDSCALTSLERHILLHNREGDIPGSEIPGIYLDYLNSRSNEMMKKVMHHNQWDIAAMAVLLGHLFNIHAAPHQLCDGSELFGMARHFERERLHEASIRCYKTCIDKAKGTGLVLEAKQRLAYLLKRDRRLLEAYSLWEELAAREGNMRIFPYIEMAKHLEHHDKDYQQALVCTQKALDIALSRKDSTFEVLRQEVLYRQQRLLRKIERT